MTLKVLSVFGTRPEAIKMSSVIKRLSRQKGISSKVCVTAQHRQMLDQVLDLFDIKPDFDLNVMQNSQTLSDLTSAIITGVSGVFAKWKPDCVLVHGDTATTLAASLAAFYAKIPVFHIEAGLRTGDIDSPWPEEANRRITGILASYHFPPTEIAKQNLMAEGVPDSKMTVTGNTVIDTLFDGLDILKKNASMRTEIENNFNFIDKSKHLILVTGHRRENFGAGFNNICEALRKLSERKDVQIVYPVHLNPNVFEPVHSRIGNLSNVYLISPQEYIPFIYLMKSSYLILTDSGGIQEEAPSLGKPVLVMRNTSERPEAISAGTAKLVGTNVEGIVSNVNQLIDYKSEYMEMSKSHNPYGDGKASQIIAKKLLSL